MLSKLSLHQLNTYVLSRQHLTDQAKTNDVVQIVKDLVGLHATSPTTPYLSLFARTRNFERRTLGNELYSKRRLGKIRFVRQTVHILSKDMIPTAYAATIKTLELASTQYCRYLGITQQRYDKTSKKIIETLKGRKMTTKQLRKELDTTLNLSPILNLMCDQFLLIRGPPEKGWKSNLHTYYLFKEYFPDVNLNADNEEKAREHIVKQYIASFGPATENDVCWWTGFPKRQITQIISGSENRITPIKVTDLKEDFLMASSDKSSLLSSNPPRNPVVSILPSLDPYLMGYKDRERYLNSEHQNFVFDRSGNATSTILLDGRVIGIWDLEEPFIKILLLSNVKSDILGEVHWKARSVGAFTSGKQVKTKHCHSMTPLTQRTAGGVMSPLKDTP